MPTMRKQLIGMSKFLSLVLRHKPETIGITLDKEGWVDVQTLIDNAAIYRGGHPDEGGVIDNSVRKELLTAIKNLLKSDVDEKTALLYKGSLVMVINDLTVEDGE